MLLIGIVGWYLYQYMSPDEEEGRTGIDYSVLLAQVDAGNVDKATVTEGKIEADLDEAILWDSENERIVEAGTTAAEQAEPVTEVESTIPPIARSGNQELIDRMTSNGVEVEGKSSSGSLWTGLLFSALPFLLFLGLIIFMGRQMTRGQQNVFGFGRSRARQNDPERPQVTFADVAGEDEAKQEWTEVVDFLRNP
ncbi:MAG: ATP-dependent metallopeptidase FtsH/Yme1/Tma family protein, partial [Thermomicrobiales bacterium]